MSHRVAVISGDGAGPEVVAEARKVVDALALALEWHELPWGTAHYHETGAMMPEDALDVVRGFDAVLLGAVGDPSVPDHVTLWGLLLPLRQGLDLWANVRPARLLDGIPSPLAGRPAVDMVFVRENTEGEYAGVGGRAHQRLELEVGLETSVFTPRSRLRVRASRGAAWRGDERHEVQRLALRLRAVGRGGRGGRGPPSRGSVRTRARGRARGAHGASPREPRRRRRLEPVR